MITTNPQETTPDLEQSRDPMAQMMAAVERRSRQVELQQMQLEQMRAERVRVEPECRVSDISGMVPTAVLHRPFQESSSSSGGFGLVDTRQLGKPETLREMRVSMPIFRLCSKRIWLVWTPVSLRLLNVLNQLEFHARIAFSASKRGSFHHSCITC